MIKHVVIWKLKDSYEGKNKSRLIEELKNRLENLKKSIPNISSLEVGKNISKSPVALDLILFAEFQNEAALNSYRSHPEHLKVVEYIKQISQIGYVVDYTNKE